MTQKLLLNVFRFLHICSKVHGPGAYGPGVYGPGAYGPGAWSRCMVVLYKY